MMVAYIDIKRFIMNADADSETEHFEQTNFEIEIMESLEHKPGALLEELKFIYSIEVMCLSDHGVMIVGQVLNELHLNC